MTRIDQLYRNLNSTFTDETLVESILNDVEPTVTLKNPRVRDHRTLARGYCNGYTTYTLGISSMYDFEREKIKIIFKFQRKFVARGR